MQLQNTKFKDGLMQGDTLVYVGDDPEGLTNEQIAQSEVQDGDSVYLVIKAGGRRFSSDKYLINATFSKPVKKPTPVTPTTTPNQGTGWYMDGSPVIQKSEYKDNQCYFNKQLTISSGSASGSQAWTNVGCLEGGGNCHGTATGSVTYTPPPSFMQPGSKVNFSISEKTTHQNTCGEKGIGSQGWIKDGNSTIVSAWSSTPSSSGTYTVPPGSAGAKMSLVASLWAAGLQGT